MKSQLTYLDECVGTYLIHLGILSGKLSETEIVKDLIEVGSRFLVEVLSDFRRRIIGSFSRLSEVIFVLFEAFKQ